MPRKRISRGSALKMMLNGVHDAAAVQQRKAGEDYPSFMYGTTKDKFTTDMRIIGIELTLRRSSGDNEELVILPLNIVIPNIQDYSIRHHMQVTLHTNLGDRTTAQLGPGIPL